MVFWLICSHEYLQKLSKKEREEVKKVLVSLKTRKNIDNLDIKKLKGFLRVFRVRQGSIRIIYSLSDDGDISILKIERRSDTTYKF